MPLVDAERREAARLVAAVLDRQGVVTLTKPEILAAVAGIDDYLDTNASAMNLAIPQPARNALTASQKAALFAYVAMRRFGG